MEGIKNKIEKDKNILYFDSRSKIVPSMLSSFSKYFKFGKMSTFSSLNLSKINTILNTKKLIKIIGKTTQKIIPNTKKIK